MRSFCLFDNFSRICCWINSRGVIEMKRLSTPILSHVLWWRHDMETISSLLTYCNDNSLAYGGLPSQRVGNENLMCSLLFAWISCWPYSLLASEMRRPNPDMTCCNSLSRRIFMHGDNGMNPIKIPMTYLLINRKCNSCFLHWCQLSKWMWFCGLYVSRE